MILFWKISLTVVLFYSDFKFRWTLDRADSVSEIFTHLLSLFQWFQVPMNTKSLMMILFWKFSQVIWADTDWCVYITILNTIFGTYLHNFACKQYFSSILNSSYNDIPVFRQIDNEIQVSTENRHFEKSLYTELNGVYVATQMQGAGGADPILCYQLWQITFPVWPIWNIQMSQKDN